MQRLRIERALRHLPRHLVREGAGGREVRDGLGQRKRDALELDDALAKLLALNGVAKGVLEATLGSTKAARRNHQALLHKPLLGQVVALTNLAQHAIGADLDVVVAEDRMLVDEMVHVARATVLLDALLVAIDQERDGAFARDVGHDDLIIGDVADRHVPLLAVEDEAVALADSLGGEDGRIRAGVLLRDRVTRAALAGDLGNQEALALLRRAVLEHVGRAPDDVPKGIRRAAELLLRQHLLEQREALATPLLAHVDGVELGVDDRLVGVLQLGRRQTVLFVARDLERQQHVVAELARTLLNIELTGIEREVHRGLLRPTRGGTCRGR